MSTLRMASRAAIANNRCLTHGDWSPKNLMVLGDNAMAIDFEVIHFGDGTFDTAFLMNHLLLKIVLSAGGCGRLRGAGGQDIGRHCVDPWVPALWNGCRRAHWCTCLCFLLARVDGKSPAEYLGDDVTRDSVRRFGRRLLEQPASSVREVFHRRLAW